MEQRTISLVLPEPPSANRYWRTTVARGGFVQTYVSAEAKEYKQTVREMAGLDCVLIGDVSIAVTWFRSRRSGDLDNRIKVFCDALQGVVFANDSQIVEIHAIRREDRDRPRIEVEVTPLGLC